MPNCEIDKTGISETRCAIRGRRFQVVGMRGIIAGLRIAHLSPAALNAEAMRSIRFVVAGFASGSPRSPIVRSVIAAPYDIAICFIL